MCASLNQCLLINDFLMIEINDIICQTINDSLNYECLIPSSNSFSLIAIEVF